ncbi:MAG: PilZ domain-containing protein [Candidatus Gastranaerophilales bacterium]|nr:PilZ domain-containing protein [Candidatus Gastranaerophilales bacterium]
MNKPFVKLVSDKCPENIRTPQLLSLQDSSVVLGIDNMDSFLDEDVFDLIIEDGPKLKFLRAHFEGQNQDGALFRFDNMRDVIKREYERAPLYIDVTSGYFKGQTLNISAGGMQVKTKDFIEENKIYDCQLNYESKVVSVKYETLRVRQNKKVYFVSGKFVDLDNEVKAFIIQQNLRNKIFGIKSSPIGQITGGSDV